MFISLSDDKFYSRRFLLNFLLGMANSGSFMFSVCILGIPMELGFRLFNAMQVISSELYRFQEYMK